MTQQQDPRSRSTLKIVLIIFGILFLICAGGGGTAVYYFFKWGRSLDVYQNAFAEAANSPQVIEYMGQPLEDGSFPQFSVNFSGGFGDASYTNSLEGPYGSGTLEIQASRSSSTDWQYAVMRVVLEDGTVIDLLRPQPPLDMSLPPAVSDPGSGRQSKTQ